MHSALVLWMVQLLLTSTHTRGVQPGSKGGEGAQETSDNEGGEAAGEDGVSEEENWDQGMGLTAVLAVDLKKEYETLSDSLKRLTVSLTRYIIYDKKKEKTFRCGQDSNLRREPLMDFKSIALTTRPPQLLVVCVDISSVHSLPL